MIFFFGKFTNFTTVCHARKLRARGRSYKRKHFHNSLVSSSFKCSNPVLSFIPAVLNKFKQVQTSSDMPGSIHHIEWCVSDLQSQVRSLVTQYGFKPIGQRIRKLGSDWIVRQVLVKSGDTVFMLTQKSRASLKDQHNGEWILFTYNARQVTDSWFSKMTW